MLEALIHLNYSFKVKSSIPCTKWERNSKFAKNLYFQGGRCLTFADFIFGPKEKINYSQQTLALNYQVIRFQERARGRHCQRQRKSSLQTPALESELVRASRRWPHSTPNHFKSKMLNGFTTKVPKVTRIKKPFQKQPRDAISIKRLLSEGNPRIILHLQKIWVTFINMVRTSVLVSRLENWGGKGLGLNLNISFVHGNRMSGLTGHALP